MTKLNEKTPVITGALPDAPQQSGAWMRPPPFSSGRPEDLVTPLPDSSRPRASGWCSRRGASTTPRR